MKRLGQYKFRTQLYFYFMLVIGLISLCMCLLLYFFLGRSYEEREQRVLTDQAKQILINVENRMEYYESYINLVTADKTLTDRLEKDDYEEVEKCLNTITREFITLNPGKIREINIYKSGLYNRQHKAFREKDLENIRQQLKRQDFAYTRTVLNEKNEKVFSIYKEIYQGNPERQFYIEFQIYESELFGFYNEDGSGNAIYVVHEDSLMSMSDRQDFLQVLRGQKEIQEKQDQIKMSAQDADGWKVVICTSKEYLNRELWSVLRSMIPVLGIILIVIFCIVMVISNGLDRKLSILQKKVMAIGRSESGETEEIEEADEFKVLGDEIDRTREHIRQLLQEIEEKNQSRLTAEMVALRAQINSHFLFNALSSLKWLTKGWEGTGSVSSPDAKVPEADILAEAIDKLAIFLRYAISIKENQVKLRDEIEQLNAYIYLQKLRCGEDLNVVVDIDEELMECVTVKLILQPLVENAVMHGRKENDSALNITIYSLYEEEYYYLIVEDDGNGMAREKMQMILEGCEETSGSGNGIRNVRNRIAICTNGEGSLTIESELDRFTKIVIKQKR